MTTWPTKKTFIKLKIVFCFFCFADLFLDSTLSQDINQEFITAPGISSRCQYHLSERKKKLLLKQRALALVTRSEKIQKIIPQQRKSVSFKVDYILKQLRQEIAILELQISQMEEEIIRQGCPGLVF